MDGLLLINKPAGVTSHDVVALIRRRFKIRRVGHGGTLDPMATGLLVLLVGTATRAAAALLEGDKTYQGTLRLGVATDTQDAQGRVTETRPVQVRAAGEIEAAVARFRGPIEQEVPAYSAVRVGGQRFYELARAGKPVPRRMREVQIRELRVLGVRLPDVDFEVTCSKGTYVRTLCADIGAALGCGGHMLALHRTRSGPFDVAKAVAPELATPENLIPIEQLRPLAIQSAARAK